VAKWVVVKWVVVIVVVAVLMFCLMFHVVSNDDGERIIIAKQSPSFAYTFISLDEFLERWNGMTVIEKTQPGAMPYLKYELTWRKMIGPVK
jgi:hypothetical protein